MTTEQTKTWQNWSRRVSATPSTYKTPASEGEIVDIVTAAAERGETVRVAGSGHSFSPVVPSDEILISLEQYTGLVDVDPDERQVTVTAGTSLATLNRKLARHELALANLGDIDKQTVAGALATGTHGTGLEFGVLANQIAQLRLVTADGEILEVGPDDPELLRAAQVSLGALGVITEVTIDVVPAYDLCLRRRTLPLEEVLDNLDEFHDHHRQWEFFWFPHTDRAIVKTFDEVPRDADRTVERTSSPRLNGHVEDTVPRLENGLWEGACRLGTAFPGTAKHASRLAAGLLPDKTSVGPSHEMFANPRNVRFHETEYGVPAGELPTVVSRLREYIATEDIPVQFPIECRFVRGDEPLLSPAHGRDSGFIAVHAYYKKSLPEYFERCEQLFSDVDGRPHWGKHHTKTANDLAERYPEWDRFHEFRRDLDPDGIFLNDHLEVIFKEESARSPE